VSWWILVRRYEAFREGMFILCFRSYASGLVKSVRRTLMKWGVEVHNLQEDYTSQLL
jgi:hypothetical protein